jgi:hypothetical protein
MNIKRNIAARSRNHSSRGKAVSVTYTSVCLCSCLVYPTCKERASYYTVIYGLSISVIFFHIISYKWHDFWKNIIKYKICFNFLDEVWLKYFSF